MDFTDKQLWSLKVPQLRNLYNYYFPDTKSWSMKKADLIEALMSMRKTVPGVEKVEMSERVKRIKKMLEE